MKDSSVTYKEAPMSCSREQVQLSSKHGAELEPVMQRPGHLLKKLETLKQVGDIWTDPPEDYVSVHSSGPVTQRWPLALLRAGTFPL